MSSLKPWREIAVPSAENDCNGSHFASLRLELQRRVPSDLRSLARRRC